MKAENGSARLQADATAQRIARVYAEALYEEAQKRNALAEILEELEAIATDVAGADPVLRSFFLGGVMGRIHRETALRNALTGKASDIVLNFILVLNKHERLELFRFVIAVYRALLQERSGKVRVRVQSATPLPEDQRSRLVAQLRELTKREPELEEKVDPELLGGLIVQVGDWLYDASVRHQLEIIRNQLIEGSSHEIQTGRDRFSTAE